ncbi:consortin [Anolis sagrei]|uniref:consortin n=1 Tax=Anolis sagrei TaxID=38937 RepID=UPI003522546C
MDERESPTNDQQLNLQDLLHTDTQVERIQTRLPFSPDENENQFSSSKHDTVKRRDNTMGRVEQDSINNNEDSEEYTSFCQDNESDKPSQSFPADEMLLVEQCTSERNNPRKTQKISNEVKWEKTATAAATHAQDEDESTTNANCSQKDPNQTLQALFSLLREEFEQMDLRLLPLYLHQIAETYFQNGEYEKAMKFVQLERLYHEQLLVNLSSIQQQWEKKWKATESSEAPDLKNSAKGLNNEELDKLAEICTSHQEPLMSRSKLISTEKSLRHQSLIGLMISEDLKEKPSAANDTDTPTWTGIGPKKENQHTERERSKSFQSKSHHMLQERAGHRLAVEKDHMEEEQQRIAESTQEPPTWPTENQSTPRSHCLSSGDASEDDSRPLREEQFSEDAAEIETAIEELAAECSSGPVVNTLIVTDADDLFSTDENVPSERNLLRSKQCSGSIVTPSSQLESSILNQQQQQPDYGSDKKSDQDRTSGISDDGSAESSIPIQACATPEGRQEKATVLEEEHEGPEDFFDRFLNGCLKDREESMQGQGDSEIASHMLSDQALYNSDGYALDESFSSLDELAKRIEIAETVPTEGLVSILKKRDDTEGKTLAQIQTRQSKRRVRFQEMDDTLDQEEVGGGSCILLILLCIATVFLSIGGTALYCTFGDAESPVCTEFATNVDFYCTRILQGIEELKHWISFS